MTTPTITRTVTETGIKYLLTGIDNHIPADHQTGYFQFALQTVDGTPTLTVNYAPDRDTPDKTYTHTADVTDGLTLPAPLVEWASLTITGSTHRPDDNTIEFTLTGLESSFTDEQATTAQPLRTVNNTYRSILPDTDAIRNAAGCETLLYHTGSRYAIAVRPVTTATPTSHPIHDQSAIPQIEIPSHLATALGWVDGTTQAERPDVTVTVFAAGDRLSPRTHYDPTTPVVWDADETPLLHMEDGELCLPDKSILHRHFDLEDVDAGTQFPTSIAIDGGRPLLTIDFHRADVECPPEECATVTAEGLTLPSVATAVFESETVLSGYEPSAGLLVIEGEARTLTPATLRTPPADQTTVQTGLRTTDEGVWLPVQPPLTELGDDLALTLGWSSASENPTIQVTTETGVGVRLPRTDDGWRIPDALVQFLPTPIERHVVNWTVGNTAAVGTFVSQQTAEAGVSESGIRVPDDGEHHRVRTSVDGDQVISLPRVVAEEFDWTTGTSVGVRIGVVDNSLALVVSPFAETDEGQGVQTTIGEDTHLRLPMRLVAALSLFDRTVTWGVTWTATGPELIGFLSGDGLQVMAEGQRVDVATVTGEATSVADTSLSVLDEAACLPTDGHRPAGFLMSCDLIDGEARLLLLPVMEAADLEIPGAMELDGTAGERSQVELPPELAAALQMEAEMEVPLSLVDDALVGTVPTALKR